MHLNTLIIIAQTVVLILGGSITFYATRAYRTTGDPSLRALAVGFGIVTLGTLVAGIVHQFLGFELSVGVAVSSWLTAVGFGAIVYSLYVE